MPPAERYQELLRLISPDTLRKNLIRAAVYIIAYEFLENLLKDRLEGFYAIVEEGAPRRGGRGELKAGKKYAEEVRAKGKDDLLVASCRWFEYEKVLTSEDIEFIKAARKHRGDLAHEMPNVLLRPGAQVDVNGLKRICELAYRVDEWWLTNVEDAPAGAESMGASLLRYFSEIVVEAELPDESSAVPGPM